jgi:hypothetical protein
MRIGVAKRWEGTPQWNCMPMQTPDITDFG